MKSLHAHFVNKYPWYARWHAHPHSTKVHYAALLLVIALVGVSLSSSVARTGAGGAAIDAQAFAEANNLHILGEDEYAVIVHQGKGKSIKQTYSLDDGTQYTYEGRAGDAVEFITYKPGVTTYISPNSNTTVYNKADFVGYDESGKIDTAIERELQKQEKVSVIVRLKLSGRFYDKADSETARAAKSQAFEHAKASVAASVAGKGKVTKDLQIINGIALEVSANALDGLRRNPNVQAVNLDRTVQAFLDTSVAEIKADQVWSYIDNNGFPLTGNGTRIAVIDTGVDYTHPDLGGCLGANCKVIGGYDFVNNDADPMDDQGHGTHVAATAAGKGLLSGVAPDAKILAYKVMNASGSGYSSNIIAGIQRTVDPNNDGNPADHADVGTMSLGGSGTPDDDMSLAVDNGTSAGVVFTIAAGNSGPTVSSVNSPGVARTAITVAAACKAAQVGTSSYCSGPIASFSSRGPVVWNGVDLKKPDVSAPGVLICAARWSTAFSGSPTCFDDHHIRISGTSMATPHMAGVVALIKQANPSLSPQQIKDQIKNTARPLSGVTYNDTGTGEVDVKAAIPFVSRIKSTPTVWTLATDATKKISSTTQSFSVTSTDTSITTPTISFTSPVPGITFTPSKTTLALSNLGTDTFTGTISVDNDTVQAGFYPLTITLMQNGVPKGAIGISLTVNQTLTISPTGQLDYGIDNPSLSSWSSSPITLTVSNKRSDIAQTVSMSTSRLPSGAAIQGTNTVTIPAGGSITIPTTLQVDNNAVANGKYSGTLTFTSGTINTSIPVYFIKFHYIVLQGDLGDSISAIAPNESYVTYAPQSPFTLYVNGAGPYDIAVENISSAHIVLKENVMVDGAPVTVNMTDASRAVSIQGTDINGGPVNLQTAERGLLNNKLGRMVGNASFYLGAVPTFYISPMTSNYTFGVMATRYTTDNPIYYFGGAVPGGTGNVTFTNTAADFKKYTFTPKLNIASGASMHSPGVFLCGYGDYNVCFSFENGSNPSVTYPYTHTVYSTAPAGAYIKYSTDTNDLSNPNSLLSPFMDLKGGKQSFNYYLSAKIPLPIDPDGMSPGIGPMVWIPRINNLASTTELMAPKIHLARLILMHQDYSRSPYPDIPYTLYKDGVSVASGMLPGEPDNYYGSGGTIASWSTENGPRYRLEASYPYTIGGKTMNASVVNSFTRVYSPYTGLGDANPPSITGFKFLGNGKRVEVYDPTASHQLQVLLDPNYYSSSIASVSLEMSADGGTFTTVPISGDGTTYTAAIPSVNATNKVAFKLTAADSSNNSLVFTFEIPRGAVDGTVPTDNPPTVSITSPANGATVSGTVTVNATATDDIGVAKVNFYIDNSTSAYAIDTTAPYSADWNSIAAANGPHTFRVEAVDTNGQITSASVSVTVNNDTAAPATAITAPTTGATVNGLVSIAATATDNVGVDHVDFYHGTTLIGADATAPYSIAWDTTAVGNGTYSLNTKAYDAAGNVGASSVVTVTVSNSTTPPPADITPPTVSLTAPSNGASISGVATLGASASDNVGVTKVSFFRGATLIDTDTTGSPNYAITWDTTTVPDGSYALIAKAYDAANNIGTSSTISVTVKNTVTPPPSGDTVAPTVSLTAPPNGTVVSPNTNVTISATATDNVGVVRLELYVNKSRLCSLASAPYSCVWTAPRSSGKTYTVTAKAYDAAGNVGVSPAIKISVRK